ncbi:MAG: phosphoglycerate dehydrogenase [Clostridiales bacterium]|nr:phosphoglycerate dehydrogenase [Clostridiales bacterium]
MKILVTPTFMQPGKKSAALDRLSAYCDNLVFNPTGKPLAGKQLIDLLKDCDGYLAGLDTVDETVLKSCPNLKAISRYGAGYDRVDTKTAADLGIPVTNTPGANAQAVAELAFGMLLCLARDIPYLHNETVKGKWVRSSGLELFGKTIGIIGLGAIGKKLANCCEGFQMKVLAYDPFIQEDYCREHHITPVTLDELLAQSDFITLHLPLLDSTWHLIDAAAIGKMKDGAILVNASRGGIIDEEAAYQALMSKKLGGLGLDAFEKEPPEASPLFTLDNVVAKPHAGAHTAEATQAMADMAVDNLIDLLEGKECRYIVNK